MKLFISILLLASTALSPVSAGSPRHIEPLDIRTEGCGEVSHLVPFYQLYHTPKTVHRYTIQNADVTNAIAISGYDFTGVAALIFPTAEPSTVPFFCLINRVNTSFFYTTSQTERDAARTTRGFSDFDTAGYIYPSQVCGSVLLYPLHFVAANSDYIYTTSTVERDDAVNNKGVTYEGITGYILTLESDVHIA